MSVVNESSSTSISISEPVIKLTKFTTTSNITLHTTTTMAVTTTTKPTTTTTTKSTTSTGKPTTETAKSTTQTTASSTNSDLEYLAIAIYAEAGGDAVSDTVRIMVGNVVLNRVRSSRFPNTIYEVLTQKHQYGMFWKTGIAWPARHTNAGEKHAVKRAYDIAQRVLDGESLLPCDVIYQAEFPQGTETVYYESGYYFCR